MAQLLTPAGYNPKIRLGLAHGWETSILHLAPAGLSGRNVCQYSTPGCRASCLNTAGRGQMTSVQSARIRKTQEFFTDPGAFFVRLRTEIDALIRRAARNGRQPAVRLNGTSDIPWERILTDRGTTIMAEYPHVRFYDYTKNHIRAASQFSEFFPSNYSLTYSRSESPESHRHALELLALGVNVAVVFSSPEYPTEWEGYPVVNGDQHDLRFLDPRGSWIGLKAKGHAKHDTSGFVVQL